MDMEFEQFHPTALYNPPEPFFLISESVREKGIYSTKREEVYAGLSSHGRAGSQGYCCPGYL